MKKLVVIAMILLMTLAGCANTVEAPTTTIPSTSTVEIEVETEPMIETMSAPSTSDSKERYIVTFEVRQSHFTLDVFEHIKDNMNEITFEVPVDKDYYDSVEEGQVINDDFRFGSLVMHGSFGKWKVRIADKQIVNE